MLGATLELGERMFAVTEVHHEHVELYIDVKMFFGESQKGCHTVHVTQDAVGVGGTFNKHLTGFQKQIKLSSQQFLVIVFLNAIHFQQL